MPEHPKKARPLQENVRYWAIMDEDGLVSQFCHRKPPKWLVAQHTLTRVTLKAVSDG